MNTDLSKRNSNFELIRIIGMLFIKTSHLAGHGVINTADVVWIDGSAVNKLFSSGLMAGGGGLGVGSLAWIKGFLIKFNVRCRLKK